MFKRLETAGEGDVVLDFEGTAIAAHAGDTVAVALLAAGVDVFRKTPGGGRARGPYCMMGVCFDCLMVIDGAANRQACQAVVRDGMTVAQQRGSRAVDVDGGL